MNPKIFTNKSQFFFNEFQIIFKLIQNYLQINPKLFPNKVNHPAKSPILRSVFEDAQHLFSSSLLMILFPTLLRSVHDWATKKYIFLATFGEFTIVVST